MEEKEEKEVDDDEFVVWAGFEFKRLMQEAVSKIFDAL